jgi:hypothetical protein
MNVIRLWSLTLYILIVISNVLPAYAQEKPTALPVDILTVSKAVLGTSADCMQYFNAHNVFPEALREEFFYTRKLKTSYHKQDNDNCAFDLVDYRLRVTVFHTTGSFTVSVSFLGENNEPLSKKIFVLGEFLPDQKVYTFKQKDTQPFYNEFAAVFPNRGTLEVEDSSFYRMGSM